MLCPNKIIASGVTLCLLAAWSVLGDEVLAQDHLHTSEPQVVSLLGKKLYARGHSDSTLVAVEMELKKEPDSVALLYQKGRALANLWRYREAFDVYDRCVELEPQNPILYRRRGHRYITIRQFEKAVAELKKASELNYDNPFVDERFRQAWGRAAERLEFDIRYHLGLAYYLLGNFAKARAEYELAYAAAIADESRVSASYWLCMTLQKMNEQQAYDEVLERITPEMDAGANQTYLDLLLLFKGIKTEDELLPEDYTKRFETVTYGVAQFRAYRGDLAGAREMFEKTVSDNHWPGFGYLAAEIELFNEKKPKSVAK